MPLPAPLSDTLVNLRNQLHNHPAHHLERPYRLTVFALLGPKWEEGAPSSEAGRRRRTHLDLAAMQRVLPLWESRFPQNNLPHQLLGTVSRVLEGTEDSRYIAWLILHAHSQCDGIRTPPGDGSFFLGYAACQCLARAFDDLDFDPRRVNLRKSDGDLFSSYNDASFLAAAAAAGGLPWDEESQPARRLEFWEWWLAEAVPAAWESVPEPVDQ